MNTVQVDPGALDMSAEVLEQWFASELPLGRALRRVREECLLDPQAAVAVFNSAF